MVQRSHMREKANSYLKDGGLFRVGVLRRVRMAARLVRRRHYNTGRVDQVTVALGVKQ